MFDDIQTYLPALLIAASLTGLGCDHEPLDDFDELERLDEGESDGPEQAPGDPRPLEPEHLRVIDDDQPESSVHCLHSSATELGSGCTYMFTQQGEHMFECNYSCHYCLSNQSEGYVTANELCLVDVQASNESNTAYEHRKQQTLDACMSLDCSYRCIAAAQNSTGTTHPF